jgi:hypothetical protein
MKILSMRIFLLFILLVSSIAHSEEKNYGEILGVKFPNTVQIESADNPVEDFFLVTFKPNDIAYSAYIGNHPDSNKRYFPKDLDSGEIFIASRQFMADGNRESSDSYITIRTNCNFPQFIQISVNPKNISTALNMAKDIKVDCSNH